jgi:hypothetical protein
MAEIMGVIPTARVLYQFQALQDFYSGVLASGYAKGNIYSMREGNAILASQISIWITDGKVKIL